MQTKNYYWSWLGKQAHFNFQVKDIKPLFLLPTIYITPYQDVNIEYMGRTIGFFFLRKQYQLNYRKNAWITRPENEVFTEMALMTIVKNMEHRFNIFMPVSLWKEVFKRNDWLEDLFHRNRQDKHYAMLVLRDLARQTKAQTMNNGVKEI